LSDHVYDSICARVGKNIPMEKNMHIIDLLWKWGIFYVVDAEML
jgi:hypothetical protein